MVKDPREYFSLRYGEYLLLMEEPPIGKDCGRSDYPFHEFPPKCYPKKQSSISWGEFNFIGDNVKSR